LGSTEEKISIKLIFKIVSLIVAAAAEDRDYWKRILRAANPSYGGRNWTTTL